MKNFKRIVGLLLCLAMIMSFVPTTIISTAKAATTTTTDVLTKINLIGTAVGGCSQNNTDSIADLEWWNETDDTSWIKHTYTVDGNTSTYSEFSSGGSSERADWYLDLSGNSNGYTAVDQLVLYAGCDNHAIAENTKVVFIQADGNEWTQTFSSGDWDADDTLTYTLDSTINATGMYVWQVGNTYACLGEIELYQYMTVNSLDTANINGVDLSEYVIVYSADDLDYAYTAAEYIQNQILLRTGRQVDIVEDNTAEATYEILVGNTNRSYSQSISAPSETAMKFTFASNGTKIALKADYFIIAGAAYYFVDTYIGTSDFDVTVNTGVTTQSTITKPAKNYIFMIGDGMGEMHTRLFEIYDVPTSGDYAYSDGEDIFYGYYLPYFGWQKTANLTGAITDSAAAGTALSTGYKTTNGYVGKDQYLNDVKNMSELAMEFGKSVAVMSTEGSDGATPAAYSAHSDGRYNDDEIIADQSTFGGLLIDGYNNYNSFTADEFEEWDTLFKNGLNAVSSDPDGFFIMYEEAHIDKVSHRLNYTSAAGYTGDTSRETLFRTVYRFNQAIGTFMEYALYNPDTMVLITADHETAGLDANFEPTEQNPVNEQQGGSVWNHSLKNVPVFSYGQGAEVFDGVTAENASYARTWAHLMTDGNADDFGNAAYPIIGSGESGEVDEGQNFYTDLPADATKVDVSAPTVGYYSDKDTNGTITEYVDAEDGPENLIDGIYDQKDNRTISGYYTYEELADGTKVPVIMFEFDEEVNVAGIKLTGYEFGRYNIEDFDIEVYAHDGYSTSWYTAATVRDAFTVGTNGEQITTPLEIGFNQIRTATKMRIIVKGITNMSAEAGDDAESAELATGSYFRIKEIEVYETEAPTVTPQPTEPTTTPTTAPTEAPTEAPTTPVGGELKEGEIYKIINNTTYMTGVAGYINSSGTFVEVSGEGECLNEGAYGRPAFLNKDISGELAAIAEIDLSQTFNIGAIEVVGDRNTQMDPTNFEIQAWVNGAWTTVKSVTNAFTGNPRTEHYTFDPVETNKIRLYITSHEGDYCSVGEIELYEVTTGKVVNKIDLTGSTVTADCGVTAAGTLTNAVVGSVTDGDKATIITFDSNYPTITIDLTNSDGTPTNVSAFSLFGNRSSSRPTSVEILVQTTDGGSYTSVGTYTFSANTGTSYPFAPYYTELGASYAAYGLQMVVKSLNYNDTNGCMLAEIELYGGEIVTPLDAPTGLTATATKNSITATADSTTGGTLMFKLDDGEWQASGEFTGLTAGTSYTVYAKYVAEDGYIDSEETSITVTTAKDIEITDEIPLVPITNPDAPIVGYYTDNNTDGAITEWLNEDTNKGKVPAVLVDGETGEDAPYNWTGYYRYDEVASGAKIPVYLFEFDDPRAFTGVEIDTYKAMYYCMEDFTVQVYTTDGEWVTATTVADSFGSKLQEEYADPETYAFAEPLYGTKIRILVDKLWNMYDWRYDDAYSFNLEYEASIRLREITLMEDPDYVPPTNTQNVLKAPAYLNTTYISADEITVVAPASTEYPEAVIQYTAYLNGEVVATNNTGVFTGLEHNTSYTFYAQYIGDGETWLNSHLAVNTTATDKDQLPAPTNVDATLGTTTITATADPIEGGTLMYRLLDENHIAIQGMGWSENNQFTGLTAGTQYTIQVKYNGDTDHYDSEITELTVVTGHILLAKPTLTVSATTHNTITLNALPTVTGGSAEYAYSTDGTNWTTTTNPVITGLEPNTTYYLKARYVATDSTHDTSLYSEMVTATTEKEKLPMPNVSVGNITDSGFTVTADTNENGTLMFRVDGGEWQESGIFTGLDRNTAYTVEAMYVGKNDYVDSDVATTTVTTLKTQLSNPTGFKEVTKTTNSITVTADTTVGGTLKFSIDGGNTWQTETTFTGLTHGTNYTVWAKYFADEDYIDSGVTTIPVKTITILDAPDLTATTVTDTSITVTAPSVTGGTLQYRINGGAWQNSGTFTGLDWNTAYTISARYVAAEGYVDSGITTISVTTAKPSNPDAGQYAYLEAIPESGITPHVGYNNYANHEMYAENTVTGGNISDAMFGTVTQIRGDDVTFTNEDLAGHKRLSVVFDLNAGATKVGAVELTGGDYNLTKFAIQVKNTSGVWQTVKFVTNDLFDISDALRNDTVLITFTPVIGTHVRLMIEGYEENANNAPEIREMVIYEVKEDARQEQKTVTSADAPAVVDDNKATVYTGNTVTLSFNEATSVKRLKLFGNTSADSIGAYTVKVQTTKGGDWTQVATGTAFSGASGENTCIVNLDQEYMAYGIQVIADGTVVIPEIEVYGYIETPAHEDPTPATTPGAVAPTEPTRPPVVSPVATQPATEEFVIPTEPAGAEPTVAVPNVSDETGSDPTVPAPVVPDESGDPVAPTAPVVTQPTVAVDTTPVLVTPQSAVVGAYDDGGTRNNLIGQRNASAIIDNDDDTSITVGTNDDGGLIDGGWAWNEAAQYGNNSSGKYTPAAVLTLAEKTVVSRVEVVPKRSDNVYVPTKMTIEAMVNGTWQSVGTYSNSAWNGADAVIEFTGVAATQIRVLVEKIPRVSGNTAQWILPEVRVYGYSAAGGSGLIDPGTPGYDKLDLTDKVIGACSSPLDTSKSYLDQGSNWYSVYYLNKNGKVWKTLNDLVDGDLTDEVHWGISDNERGDFVLDLRNGGSGTAIDHIVVYSNTKTGYKTPTAYEFVLILEDGSTVTKNLTAGTSTGVAYTCDLDQTYTVNGVYVWATDTNSSTDVVFGEIELYQKKTVTLDAPTVNWTEKNDTSITVKAAKIDASIGKLQFSIDGSWKDAVDGSYTFENLTGNTAYTIQARYLATGDGYVTSATGSATVTTEATPATKFTVSGTTTAGATVKLYKDGAVVNTVTATNGSYSFSNVSIGAYTVAVTLNGYNPQTQVIVVDKNLTVPAINLTQPVYTVSGTTTAGATVKLYKDGVVKYTATVDGTSYSFNNVVIGQYTLVATKDGYNAKVTEITVNQAVSQNMTLTQAVYTVTGTANAGATVTLYKNKAIVQTTTADENGAYSFSNVAIGKYTLVVAKNGYISKAEAITVDANKTTESITLEEVPINSTNVVVDAVANTSYNVRLYEPWALRVNVTFYTEKNGTAINLSTFKSYGAYAIIANKFGDGTTEPTSWEEIISDPDAVQFRMAAEEGDCNMFAVNDTTAVFDYYDGLYTYRLAENVYWVAYYEDAEGTIHFTKVNRPVLMDKVDNVLENIADDTNQETQRIVLEHMKQLHYALKEFRGEDAEFGEEYTNDVGVLNYGQNLSAINASGYQFGKTHKIRLIEPWGLKVTYQVKPRGGAIYADADFENLQDYGMIFYHDKTCAYNGDMTSAQVLAMNDVYIYSKSRGNVVLEDGKMTAIYTKELYTYILDSDVFCVPFVVDAEGNYHYSTNANRMNLIDQMYAYYNNATLSNQERATFKAMIQLHESTMIHRKKYGK